MHTRPQAERLTAERTIVTDEELMRRAIDLSMLSIEAGGGPFGAVVARDGTLIAEGTNRVVPAADPTAHAEIVAIRDACARINTHTLEGATIYTTCEPCPMCLGAIWWARLGMIVYGNSRDDASSIGFDDDAIYEEVATPIERRRLPMRRMIPDETKKAFDAWLLKADRTPY
jgi:guanine deaminase